MKSVGIRVCDNGEKCPAASNGPLLRVGGIISLYWNNALTGQVNVLVAEIDRVCPLRNESVFD